MKKAVIVGIVSMLFMPAMAINENMNHASFITDGYGKTLYVGGSGPNNYTKIQDAIDDAMPGDTVFIYDDSSPYYEHLVIEKSIGLIGENRDTTIIDGRNSCKSTVSIKWNNVYMRNLTIKNTPSNATGGSGIGLHITGYNVLISNCNIIKNRGAGVIISDSHNVTIKSCNVSDNGEVLLAGGIYISGGASNRILKCEIYSNDFDGIILDETKGNIVESCNIAHHDDFGIQISSSIGNKIIHCNLSESWIGMFVCGSFFNSIFSNNFCNNKYHATFSNAGLNIWLRNYWDNWPILLPKPIFGIWYRNPYRFFLQWVNFDWMPRLRPYEWDA